VRHEDNFLSDYDLWMHQRYKDLLSEVQFRASRHSFQPSRMHEAQVRNTL
jgi:hypothetical protein